MSINPGSELIKSRQALVRHLLKLKLSDKKMMVYSQGGYTEMLNAPDGGCWPSLIPSPLGGCLDVADSRAEQQAINYTWGTAPIPKGPLAPGIIAELLYHVGMLSEYADLICESKIAYDHIMRLEGFQGLDPKVDDAQELAMSARAKGVAFDILLELNSVPKY